LPLGGARESEAEVHAAERFAAWIVVDTAWCNVGNDLSAGSRRGKTPPTEMATARFSAEKIMG
jgi:hypothetical protein